MSEHTEGKWGYEEGQTIGGNYFAQIVKLSDTGTKELGQLADFEVSKSETKANAQLIAAAPDLLEAAKKIQKLADENRIEITDNSHSAQLFFDELFKAIQKVEGDNDEN